MNHPYFWRLWDVGTVALDGGLHWSVDQEGLTAQIKRTSRPKLEIKSLCRRLAYNTKRNEVISAVFDLCLCPCVRACASGLPTKVLSIFHQPAAACQELHYAPVSEKKALSSKLWTE